MRDEQLTVGGRPKLVLGVDLKNHSPYKMIMSERGLTNVRNQGVTAPRISREVTFVYVGFFFFLSFFFSNLGSTGSFPHTFPPRATHNLNTNTSKTTCKIILYGQNDKIEMRIWHKGALYKSDHTCNISLRYLSCQLIHVPPMVAISWPKHAAGTATQLSVRKTGVVCCDGRMEAR
jgi:hypothetical protein